MLVCLREVNKTEQAHRLLKRVSTPHYERYYSLFTSETSATIVDVVDSRARKTFNYDVAIRSPLELQEQVVEPLLLTVLEPDRAAQAVVVVDGAAGNRAATLLNTENGVLTNTARAAAAHPDVASLSFSAVTLEDNNTLSDVLAADAGADVEEVTILEDTVEQFTSVEDAHYVSLDDEEVWSAVLQRVTAAFAVHKHHVFSFIFSFHASTGRPNTTMQFISFSVGEVARGMKSSRHAVSSAAGLIECRSPTLTFTATKLLYLLKPALLGQQPGAWVACFSPISVVEAADRETFQEAFAVAQTASRLYSARIALMHAASALLPPSTPSAARIHGGVAEEAPEEAPEEETVETDAYAVPPLATRPGARDAHPPPRATAVRGAYGGGGAADSDDGPAPSSSAHSAASSTRHLVRTPANAATLRREAGNSTLSDSPQAHPPVHVSPPPPLVKRATAVQTERESRTSTAAGHDAPTRESIQRGVSEEQSALRYEFETYRTVMEGAMAKLRAEMRSHAEQITAAREEVRAQRRRRQEMRAELEDSVASRDAAMGESAALRRALEEQRRSYEQRLREASQRAAAAEMSASAAVVPAAAPQPLVSSGEGEVVRGLRDEVQLLEVRVAELTELVAFHQAEIREHVARESAYRSRILDLEAAVRAHERDVIASRAAAQEAQRTADAAVVRAAASAETRVASPHVRTDSAVLRDELHGVEERAAEAECSLRAAMDALQRERTHRQQLETLLQQREREESARSTERQTEAVVHALQQGYEHQLRELRSEMSGFRAQLEQQLPHTTPTVSHDSSLVQAAQRTSRWRAQTSDSGSQAPPPRPPTPLRMSPMPEAAAPQSGGHGTPSQQSPRNSTRHSQSFEEYMKEEPHYELHRASFLRPRARPTQ